MAVNTAGQSDDRHRPDQPQRLYALPTEEPTPFPARDIMYAIARAYPDRIDRVAFRDGDWALRLAGTWYYYSGGLLLPESDRDRAGDYDPYPFYNYPESLIPLPSYSAEEAQKIETLVDQLEDDPIRRHTGLLDGLWRITDPESAWERQKTTYFLGFQTLVHRELLEDLAAVEERVLQLAETDPEVARFISSLSGVFGYYYREVDGTDSLSYHAYGAAIDLMPSSYQRWQMYWRWARNTGRAWYEIDYSDRYIIPDTVVRAFEAHGFIWGGKWHFYDTIHFEYRPEILLLNDYAPGTSR